MSKTPAVPTRKRRWRHSQGFFAACLLAPAILVVFGIIIYPIIQTGVYAFTDVRSAMHPKGPFVGFGNFSKAMTSNRFWSSMGRTLYFTIVSTAAELVIGLGIAGLLNAKIRGRWLLRTVVVIPWAIPTIVNGALWKGIFHAQYGSLNALLTQLGILNSYKVWLGTPWGAMNMVIIADVWKTVPLVAFLLLAGLASIPEELYEAAKIDRAGRWKTFWSITVPLMLPAISIVMILRVIEAFKVFDVIYAMTRGGPADGTKTIAYYTYTTAFSDQNYGIGSALAYIIVIVIALLSAIYLRALRRSEMSLI
ncbi:MAG: sugar ABC transporter permease [Propionibacteriaceae bacterium]|jgi:multiple sugar transport system permease protein/N,N'-diacetylchitobiose transport system permease protein|nr:sugar ABC transporter permease [Propionibacteriaceae bacterium]